MGEVDAGAASIRPRPGRALGIDLGTVRIGIALSDPSRTVASPHTVLPRSRSDHGADHRAIVEIARAEAVTTIVVGLPLSLSGATGPAARAAEAEIEELRSMVGGVEVVAHDERLTTVTAERSLGAARMSRARRREVVDKVAAAVMLQSWLDRSLPDGSR